MNTLTRFQNPKGLKHPIIQAYHAAALKGIMPTEIFSIPEKVSKKSQNHIIIFNQVIFGSRAPL